MIICAAFLGFTVLLVYVYAGYPALLFLTARWFPRPHRFDDTYQPSVTIIISAYNEEKIMAAKIRNTLNLDYPAKKLSVLVVSDGSTDRTDEIVKTFEDRGVGLIRPSERRGKTTGLNLAARQINSEIIVFSDANALYDASSIRLLVRHFSDEKVGYVVGHARYKIKKRAAASESENAYWDFEVKIKEWESAGSSVVGGDGALYAIRTELYEPLNENDINDFVNPLQIVARGYRGIFDPEAWCTEEPAAMFEKEFSRKVRIVNRSFNGLLRVPGVCNPFKVGRFAWQVISHKLLRWFSPFAMGLHFVLAVTVAGIAQPVGMLALTFVALYGLLAAFAWIGWGQRDRLRTPRIFSLPCYFVLANLASIVGIFLRFQGKVISVWDTVRTQISVQPLPLRMLPVFLTAVLSLVMIKISWILAFCHGCTWWLER